MADSSDSHLKQRFFDGMSSAATTVNVVTTDGPAGRAGVTVSAMSPVSADMPKPTLLVCINEKSAAAPVILDNGVFCVNVLRDDQSYISDVFAGRFKHGPDSKFDCAEWETGQSGAPRVVDALTAFDCRLVSADKVGTHHICIGEVEDIVVGRHGSALVYANRAYGSTSPLDTVPPPQVDDQLAGNQLALGCFHSFGPFIMPKFIAELSHAVPGVKLSLLEGDTGGLCEALTSGKIDLAFLYDFALGPQFDTRLLVTLDPYVLLPDGHRLTARQTIAPADLASEPMISVTEAASRTYFEDILQNAGVEPIVVFRASSFEMMRGMVGSGLGFAIAMTKPASPITYDGRAVVSRRLRPEQTPGHVVLARRRHKKSTLMDTADIVAQKLFAVPNCRL